MIDHVNSAHTDRLLVRGAPDDDIPSGMEDESRRYELLNDIGSETEAAGIHHFSTPFSFA